MQKNVLITGASKGIGESIARLLSKKGYSIYLSARNEEKLRFVSDEIGAKGYLAIDLLSEGACEKLINKFNDVDILINNAGDYIWSPVEETKEEDIDRLIKLNLSIPYRFCSLVSKRMKQNRWGRIINIGSISGAVGEANASLYSASKSGLIGMSKSLALELAEFGVTVNVVNPGWVKTELCKASFENGDLDEQQELDCIPQKRFITPEEIAKMVEYLCSNATSGLTGQSLNLCAGLSLG